MTRHRAGQGFEQPQDDKQLCVPKVGLSDEPDENEFDDLQFVGLNVGMCHLSKQHGEYAYVLITAYTYEYPPIHTP